jgi:predicted DNA-binding protein YlxM (UPF0122 family)
MSNQDVANTLGVTRQAVHNSLKKSIPKMYIKYKKLYKTEPYETFQEIITGLKIQDEKDIKTFYKYLNDKQKLEIEEDLKDKGIHA